MTEDRIGNISKAIGAVIAALIISLALIAKAFGQHSHDKSDLARFRLVRIIPAKVTYIETNEFGKRVEYVAKDSKEIENGYFQKTKETKGDDPKKGEYFWFAYCAEDRHLYSILTTTAEQRKALE